MAKAKVLIASVASARARKSASAASEPIGDNRTTTGSVSDLQAAVRELRAIVAGAYVLLEADQFNWLPAAEHNVENAAELLKLAEHHFEQLDELIAPEGVSHG